MTVVVTAGSVAVFGEALTDPVEIVSQIGNVWVSSSAPSPSSSRPSASTSWRTSSRASYDLSNVAPKYIDFRRGGLISAVAAVVILPWQLYNSPVAINYFLGGLGALLGPLFGIIFADYFLLRKQRVLVEQLYSEDPDGPHWYRGGWNPKALAAFVPSALICLVLALVPSSRRWRPTPGSSAWCWAEPSTCPSLAAAGRSPHQHRQPGERPRTFRTTDGR